MDGLRRADENCNIDPNNGAKHTMKNYIMALIATLLITATVSTAQAQKYRHATVGEYGTTSYLPHPRDCPHIAFCSCGAAVDVYGGSGLQYRNLWPSCAWFSGRFARVAPAPNMVAGHCGHVFVLKQHISGTVWLVADYNSGEHRSRLHARDIGRSKVVDPHSAKMASR